MSRCLRFALSISLFSGPLAAQAPEATDPPVALHAGVSYARVPDVDFEIVGSLAGQALFARTGAREGRTELVAFLSHRVWRQREGSARAHATLGTGLGDPGAVLYFGASLGIARAHVTAGAATTLVEEGVDSVADEVFGRSGDRTLYASLRSVREWGVFVAVSFGMIP